MIILEVIILMAVVGNLVGAIYTHLKVQKQLGQVAAILSESLEDQYKMKQQLATTGRVLGVFEDELQVIQKRRDRDVQLKTRFTRTPR